MDPRVPGRAEPSNHLNALEDPMIRKLHPPILRQLTNINTDSLLLQTLSSGFCAFKESRNALEDTFAEWQHSILKPLGASVIRQNVHGRPSELVLALFPLVSPTKTIANRGQASDSNNK